MKLIISILLRLKRNKRHIWFIAFFLQTIQAFSQEKQNTFTETFPKLVNGQDTVQWIFIINTRDCSKCQQFTNINLLDLYRQDSLAFKKAVVILPKIRKIEKQELLTKDLNNIFTGATIYNDDELMGNIQNYFKQGTTNDYHSFLIVLKNGKVCQMVILMDKSINEKIKKCN